MSGRFTPPPGAIGIGSRSAGRAAPKSDGFSRPVAGGDAGLGAPPTGPTGPTGSAPGEGAGVSGSDAGGGATLGISVSDGAVLAGTTADPQPSVPQPLPATGRARSRSWSAAVRSRRCSTARFWAQQGRPASPMTTLSCWRIVPLLHSQPTMLLL